MKKLLILAAFGLFATPAFGQNTASVSSTGNGNEASIDQTYVAGDVATGNDATITQVGDQHGATIEQSGAGNVSSIDQSGFGHSATETTFLGYSNSMTVVQQGGLAGVGGGNRVSAAIRGDLNQVDIYQEGSGNDAYLRMNTQQNDGNVVDIDQLGTGNDVRMSFNSRNDRNTITTWQEGTGNSLGIWGGGVGNIGLDIGNDADDNTVDVYQYGQLNDADIVFGEGSTFNTVDLDQTGNGHYALIEVSGSGNTAVVTQQ